MNQHQHPTCNAWEFFFLREDIQIDQDMKQCYVNQGQNYQIWKLILAGIVAALSTTPVLTIVYNSVVIAANGTLTLFEAFLQQSKRVLNPIKFIGSFQFQWTFFVAALTYAASNTSSFLHFTDFLSPALNTLIIAFLVNTTSSLAKDKAITQRLGKIKGKAIPPLSLFLFFLRDVLAMASAFTIPPALGLQIQKSFDLSHSASTKIAQMISPMIVQIPTTFIQLLAIDLHNRRGQSLSSRFKNIKSTYYSSLLIRMIGFTIAYGIGGIVNMEMKIYLHQ